MSLSSTAAQQYLKVGSSLPVRLQRFFAQYPPQNLPRALPESSENLETAPATPNDAATNLPKDMIIGHDGKPAPSPFAPHKDPITGRWHNPAYSLRRQADLVKLARQHGVDDLLPFTEKHPQVKLDKLVENGMRIRGTGVGQRVKGHKWERELIPKLDTRRNAMLEMTQLVQTWKQRGHGRGWKKWPK